MVAFTLLILNILPAQAGTFKDIGAYLGLSREKAGYTEGDYTTIVANVINAMLGLVGAIFFILIIYGGFMWMISRGEDDKVKKARNIIVYAVIGLIIVAAAYAITSLVAGWT